MEAVQLEDGSTAYIHHPPTLHSGGGTILTLQPGGGLEELAAEDAAVVDADTITTLENYAVKVRLAILGPGGGGIHPLGALGQLLSEMESITSVGLIDFVSSNGTMDKSIS